MDDGQLNVSFEPEHPTLPSVLDHIEAILLAAAEPPLNLQRGRFGDEVQQYLQHVPHETDDDDDDDED